MSANFKKTRTRGRRKGIALLWVALTVLLFIGFVGLALDTGFVYYTAEQLQGVADGSSLAGARFVKTNIDAARDAAVSLALLNKAGGEAMQLDRNSGNAADGDVVVGRFDRNTQLFSPTTDKPNAVRVIGRRTSGSLTGSLPLIFARSFGVNNSNVSRDAVASMGAGTDAGLIVLNCTRDCSLELNGGATLTVLPCTTCDPSQTCEDGASIFVNSSSSSAACVPNNATVQTTGMWIRGGFSGNTGSVTSGPCPWDSGATPLIRQNNHTWLPLPDPLGCVVACGVAGHGPGICVPEPSTSGLTKLPSPDKNADQTIEPGWYDNGITRTGGLLKMKPGVYILGDTATNKAIFNFSGNAELCAEGVMIYIKAGGVDITGGTGNKYLDPIDTTKPPPTNSFCTDTSFSYPGGIDPQYDTPPGILFFQSRSNTNEAKINGSSALHITGVVYFPSNLLRVGGTGFSLGTQVIVDSLLVSGNAEINISYDGRNPGPASSEVFLVE